MTTEGSDMPDQPETDHPDKLDLRSLDIADERQQELLRLFPEVRTEGGKLDFDRLKLSLGEAVDVGKERYGMSWPGKADCFRTIQAPSLGTLRPSPEESVAFDATENLIIEGDNLEVLKLLQKSYLGKVKMIYIDPPYNTGNDFIYPDNYTESLQTYLEYTGQVDDEGHKFGTNTDTDGRFHSKWLNMMYPRLYLARNLLREDGVIFISIDDNEVDNLRKLCDEVFGAENFVVPIIWQKRITPENRRAFSFEHDYVLCYARTAEAFGETRRLLPLTPEARARYRNPDNDPRGDWQSVPAIAQAGHGTKSQFYRLETPDGRVLDPPPGRCWLFTEARMHREIAANNIWFGKAGDGVPRVKRFLSDARQGITPSTLWLADAAGANEKAKKEVSTLFEDTIVFDAPKPTKLVQRMLSIATEDAAQDVVLDFFAGSGTTAHAVLDLNKQDGGNRRFILVQLPEPTGREDYPTIADITKERVRRVIAKLSDEDAGKLDLDGGTAPDRGFRVFKLAESNFKPWNAQVAHDAQALEEQLDLHVDHVREGRSNEDLLYEILLKSGFPLTTPVDAVPMAGKTVYAVAGGALFICLERELTLEVIRTMADSRPERVVCLDEGFAGNDQLKANAVQIFKTKGVTSFKTV
jgi:adenine-specific DNA-methyltransferase